MTSSKKFICTGTEVVDVTMRSKDEKLVMVSLDMLNDIYQQGFMDGVSDTLGESTFFSVYTMEVEDEHA